MPWALHENLIITATPTRAHFVKYGWENVGLITLNSRRPDLDIGPSEPLKWWSHIPIADGQIRDLQSVVRARDTALSMMGAGHLTIVHCVAGRNRSGLVGALVVRELRNMTGSEAMAWVRQCRPNAIDNEHFERFLDGLERPR